MATKKYKRMITGLIVSNEEKITVGRRRKHELRAALQYALMGKLTESDLARLSGWLAFIKDVEPDAYEKVEIRYGRSLIEMIKANSGGWAKQSISSI